MDTRKSTSSRASADGHTPFASPAGQTTSQSGPAPVPVSRFRAQDSGKAMPINDICGPLFTASSPSADLQRSLENRLRARMGESGTPLYDLTWRILDMPAGAADLAAASVGAPHIRQRVFWVANRQSQRLQEARIHSRRTAEEAGGRH